MIKYLPILYFIPFIAFGQSKGNTPVPYTLADRDRLIKVEVEITALRNEMNARFGAVDKQFEAVDKQFETIDKRFEAIDKRFEDINRRISSLETLMYILISGVFGLIGFIVWDRRTFTLQLEKRIQMLEEKST